MKKIYKAVKTGSHSDVSQLVVGVSKQDLMSSGYIEETLKIYYDFDVTKQTIRIGKHAEIKEWTICYQMYSL